jgi:hypothetical protein
MAFEQVRASALRLNFLLASNMQGFLMIAL